MLDIAKAWLKELNEEVSATEKCLERITGSTGNLNLISNQ